MQIESLHECLLKKDNIMLMKVFERGNEVEYPSMYNLAMLLRLACDHGWKPAGPLSPESSEQLNHERDDGKAVSNADENPDVIDLGNGFTLQRLSNESGDRLFAGLQALYGIGAELVPYVFHGGVRVLENDATALARALNRAMRKLSDGPVRKFKSVKSAIRVKPSDYFSGENKRWLRNMIAFIRRGSFTII